MQHESFSSPEVAALLNQFFIPIKVDREERPDIDETFMSYVTATTGSGGWPLNIFVTPDLDPLFGGTYWPASDSSSAHNTSNGVEDGPLDFVAVLKRMQSIWSTQRERCILSAQDATSQLRSFAAEGTYSVSPSATNTSTLPEPLELDLLDDALAHFVSRYDSLHAGFTPSTPNGPKFPTPPNLAFLLRLGAATTTTSTRFGFPSPIPPIIGKPSCLNAAAMALQTLRTISRSALCDHLSPTGGFHRYSISPDWNVPHFEKMLHDNALLLGCYCDAWALYRDPEVLGTIYSLVEYFTNPSSPVVNVAGGFFASEAAYSNPSNANSHTANREGAFYVWTLKEIRSALSSDRDAAILARHFGVMANGNVPAEYDRHDEFLNQNTLRITATPSVLAKEFGLGQAEIVKIIKAGRAMLAEWRIKERARPSVDKKIITSWNALAISALCRAANTLADIDETRSKRCKDAAVRAADFIKTKSYNSSLGTLRRAFPPHGDSPSTSSEDPTAFIDDYAYLIQACMALYDITFSQDYLVWAQQLQEYVNCNFWDKESGGYFQAPSLAGPPGPSALSTSPDGEAAPSTITMPSVQKIVRLKPGTDTALPSPNGVVALNLLYLAGYLSSLSAASALPIATATEPNLVSSSGSGSCGATSTTDVAEKYALLARQTISAFGVEILQHPFLFVTLLGAVVLDVVGVKNIVLTGDWEGREQGLRARELNGWGRTAVKIPRDEAAAATASGGRDEGAPGPAPAAGVQSAVLICEKGQCREMRRGELDEGVDFERLGLEFETGLDIVD